jgi:hypothetical protein
MLLIFLLTLGIAYAPGSVSTSVLAARCLSVGETPDQRVSPPPMIAPGAPPLLSFRYYEGAVHHRYGNADLMLDDAGH